MREHYDFSNMADRAGEYVFPQQARIYRSRASSLGYAVSTISLRGRVITGYLLLAIPYIPFYW